MNRGNSKPSGWAHETLSYSIVKIGTKFRTGVGLITHIFRSSSAIPYRYEQLQWGCRAQRSADKAGKVGRLREKAPDQITTTEEIIASPEEGMDEVKEEIKKVPSRHRRGLHQLAAVWERLSARARVSGSGVVVSHDLDGMYGAKFQALAKEHQQGR